MAENMSDQVLALGGMCQAALLVSHIARQGECDEDAMRAILASLLVTDPRTTADVFDNNISGLRLGLSELEHQFRPDGGQRSQEVTKYVLMMLAIEKRVHKKAGLLDQMGERIGHLQRQVKHFDLLDEQMLANTASIYTDLISPLPLKIEVRGAPMHLKQVSNQNKIRSLLLAGLRCTILWRQVGGRRTHFLFRRSQINRTAAELLKR